MVTFSIIAISIGVIRSTVISITKCQSIVISIAIKYESITISTTKNLCCAVTY